MMRFAGKIATALVASSAARIDRSRALCDSN